MHACSGLKGFEEQALQDTASAILLVAADRSADVATEVDKLAATVLVVAVDKTVADAVDKTVADAVDVKFAADVNTIAIYSF